MIELYGDPRSGNTRRVQWLLEELGERYEFRLVSLRDGEQKRPEYVKLNPNGKVPTIVEDGFTLWESEAILWYLAESRGKFLPQSAGERAIVHQWLAWNAQHLAKGTYDARALRMMAMRLGKPMDEQRHAEILASAPIALKVLDAHLEEREYVAAGSLTIADVGMGMNLTFGIEEGVRLDGFPNVARWHAALMARPAYRKVNG